MWRVLSQSGARVLRFVRAWVRACVRMCWCVGVSAILRDSPSTNMNNNAAPGASDNDCRVSGLWLCPYALLTYARRSAETVSRIPPRRRGRGVRGPPAPHPWCLCDVQDVVVVVVPGEMSNEKWLTPAIRPTVPAWRIATQTSSPWLVNYCSSSFFLGRIPVSHNVPTLYLRSPTTPLHPKGSNTILRAPGPQNPSSICLIWLIGLPSL